jgi:PilZ domain-containing protein
MWATKAETMLKNKDEKKGALERSMRAADRRISQRFNFGWDAVIRRSDITGIIYNDAGKLRDLSSAGALVDLAKRLKVGDEIEIYIKLPLKREVWVKYAARVVRLNERASGSGAAIRFEKLRPEFIGVARRQI